jgi:hypothetical protein
MPGRDPNKVYRCDWRRERAWEALDAVPAGVEFTVRQLWTGEFGSRPHTTFSMTYRVIRDALNAGLLETTGRDHTRQGCPRLYRRTS